MSGPVLDRDRVHAARQELEHIEDELAIACVAASDDEVDIHDALATVVSRIGDRVRAVRESLDVAFGGH